jgi:hypothetical protein
LWREAWSNRENHSRRPDRTGYDPLLAAARRRTAMYRDHDAEASF